VRQNNATSSIQLQLVEQQLQSVQLCVGRALQRMLENALKE
jgi:hypothetical protein